jgi:hypothetical protein
MNDNISGIPIKPRKHYVNNVDFCEALVTYKERKKSNPNEPIPNYIGECFLKIAEGLSHKPNFINYPCREEMVADGIENCLMYFENFDPSKSSNAFAYFTQIIYYAFLRRIQKEKTQMYIKYKATQQFGILDEYDLLESEDGITHQFELYDNISEFIETFEETKKKKKKVSSKPKGIENFLE